MPAKSGPRESCWSLPLKVLGGLLLLSAVVALLRGTGEGGATHGRATATSGVAMATIATVTRQATTQVPAPSATSSRAATAGPSPTPSTSPTATPTPTPSLSPTASPTPLPIATERPGAPLQRALQSKLGKSGRTGDPKLTAFAFEQGRVTVRFAIDDLLFTSMTAWGAKSDVKGILQTVQNWLSKYDSVRVEGTFTLEDAYGNVAEERVLLLLYTRETIDRINWSGIDIDRIYDIADMRNVHLELR